MFTPAIREAHEAFLVAELAYISAARREAVRAIKSVLPDAKYLVVEYDYSGYRYLPVAIEDSNEALTSVRDVAEPVNERIEFALCTSGYEHDYAEDIPSGHPFHPTADRRIPLDTW